MPRTIAMANGPIGINIASALRSSPRGLARAARADGTAAVAVMGLPLLGVGNLMPPIVGPVRSGRPGCAAEG